MQFLQNLILSGGILSCLVAFPSMGHEGPSINHESDKNLSADENILSSNPLSQTRSINNPYTADKPFTIVEPSYKATEALASVTCGGETWTDGELLGIQSGQEMRTFFHQGRIYFKRGGVVVSPFFVFQAQGTKYPNTPPNNDLLNSCVNDNDPSTASPSYLGAVTSQGIYCNNKLITDKLLLGSYNGGERIPVFTYLYAHVNKELGILRITAHRDENGNPNNYDGFNGSLMDKIIAKENGSFVNPDVGFNSYDIIKGCFYDKLPVYPDAPPSPNCTANPTIGTISNVTQTGLTFNYSGAGVTSVKWRIKNSGNSQVASGTTSTTTSNLTFGSLPEGNYNLEIEGNNCTSAPNSKGFTVTAPVVGLPECLNGPAITNITAITPSTATVTFTGDNLSIFSWRILNGTKSVAYGKTNKLSTKSANLDFNYLPAGNYSLELTPVDCRIPESARVLAPTRAFTITPTADNRPNCERGPTLGNMVTSNENALTFQFDGEGVFAIDWKILQNNNVVRQNRVRPSSSTPTIEYPTLPNGTYTLQILGGTCNATTTSAARTFVVNSSLPIYIASFKGTSVEKGVELSWEVVSEKDGEGFEILRFGDMNKTPEVIGKVMLTDKRTGTYQFTDEAPLLGTNYYQLKQNDLDGSFTKSKIISITPKVITGSLVAPNPATDYVNMQFSSRTSGTAQVDIYNVSGLKVGSTQVQVSEGKNTHRIQVGKLAVGNYILKVSHQGESSKLRFMKAN